MSKNEVLSSAMADEQIARLTARKEEIAESVEQRKAEFDESDVEKRDSILNEVEEMTNEAKDIENEITEMEEVREQFKEQEKRMNIMENVKSEVMESRATVVDKYDTPEYREAWVNYIKTGDDKELRTAGLSTATSNVPVPTIFQGYVETAWYNYGKFSRLVNKSYVAGYLSIPFESAADGAVVHTELADAPSEEEITLGLIELKPAMIKKWISLTDEIMAMAADEFMRYVADELVYRVVLKLDEGIIKGAVDTNGKGVVGIVGNANTESYTAAPGFNIINEAISGLVTFDNLTIAMNPASFFNNIMGLTDQVGRPIYQIAQDNTGRPQYYISGHRVEFTQALPAYNSAQSGQVWAVVGDFRGYRLNLPEGDMVRTLVDPFTLTTADKVRMIGRLYAAGNVARIKHFVQIKVPLSA